jgi:transcriptional regulator with XRE-family HTH domain
MLTAGLSAQQAGLGSVSINSIKQQMLEALKDKEYRQAFIEESIRSRITAQINALRNEREWDYRTFAESIGKKLSWAYRLEDPNSAAPTIPTLLEVAQAFDIGLDVRFRRFSELLEDVTTMTPKSFLVPSFDSELQVGAFNKRRNRRKRHSGYRKSPKLVRRSKRPSGEASMPEMIGSTRFALAS